MKRSLTVISVILLLCTGCASWYQRSLAFQEAVGNGEFGKAEKILQKDREQSKSKNRILYLMNQGYVSFMQGEHEKSNAALEEAEDLAEIQSRNLLTETAALLSNPEIRPYRPEDFELIMINFYKALNYLQSEDMEEALVEVRKINLKLRALNDKYPRHKNRYSQDAFAHLLMGLIYDASGDSNNAFIAYRNAYDTYNSLYSRNFGLQSPMQLKKDMIRTAQESGLTEEMQQYCREFGMDPDVQPATRNEMILFWLNGQGPVKAEWGLDFTKFDRGGGVILFRNEESGLSFPFFSGSYSADEGNALANLELVRVAFPKYQERPLTYTAGRVTCQGKEYKLEEAEDINAIAFKTLRDRMLREFSTSLIRVAAKQGIKQMAGRQNQWIGLAVGLTNALTEKADTRNWQTLPYSISYARIPLEDHIKSVGLEFSSPKGHRTTQRIDLPSKRPRTLFSVFHTL